jgi:leucyl/phenylalanyl-tRNA--protein transferase
MRLPFLGKNSPFPPTSQALTAAQGANGLLAAGADLSVERLIDAYSRGIFPWYSQGEPLLWWSPSPRMVLQLANFKVTRSLRKTLKRSSQQTDWRFTMDHAFPNVLSACASPREGQGGTWIVQEMQEAYLRLHNQGIAHSVESWFQGELVGGLYLVSIGRMVFGESMFSRKTDASKMALAHLVNWLSPQGVKVIDCQQNTRHLASLGAAEMPRETFEQLVNEGVSLSALNWAPQVLEIDHDTAE